MFSLSLAASAAVLGRALSRRRAALLLVLAVALAGVPIVLGPPGKAVAAPSNPLFFGCSRFVTFDDGPEKWRAMTTQNEELLGDFGVAGWTPDEGNPDGAIKSDDLDNQWSEFWTPPLAVNGYDTDYRFAIGGELQFDYRNNTGIDVDVYVAARGVNGERYYYVFRPQITDSTKWNRIRVPMDPAQWLNGFNNDTGPTGSAPTAEQFSAVLADVDYFAFSIEGQSGPDTTLLDNFGAPCEDYGDAPDGYGTVVTDSGPSHRIPGFAAAAHTAPLMLGSRIDVDADGMPGATADGDETTGVDDEDGVTAAVTTLVGRASTVTVAATNNTDAPATLAGWIDLDGNGSFDVGERVLASIPQRSGTRTYPLEFAAGTTTENTYARFRILPGEVADPQPVGSASAGEVEDYPVTVTTEETARELTITKSTTATAQTRAGDTVTYTVTATNTGPGDYTAADPASWADDLTGTVDDATYNGDARAETGSVSYDSPTLSWSGPIPAGESASVTYTVTVTGAGDRVLHNTACITDGACASTETELGDEPEPTQPAPKPEPDKNVGSGGNLAETGVSEMLPVLLGGITVLLIGGGLIVLVRRRHEDTETP